MANYKPNVNYDDDTFLAEYYPIIKDNINDIYNIANKHMNGEADRHTAADIDCTDGKTVQATLDTERTERTNADTALGKRIDTETKARTNADTALGKRIDAEQSARIAEDTALGKRIDAEQSERTNADTALGKRIDAEQSERTNADAAIDKRIDNIINNTVKIANSDGGGAAVGASASADGGGAVGNSAVTVDGGAAGYYAHCLGGGGAMGCKAYAEHGGAVGNDAATLDGFAGGYNAKTVNDKGNPIDAVQLGTGVNDTEKTFQVYDYRMMNADGTIPVERLSSLSVSIGRYTLTPQVEGVSVKLDVSLDYSIGEDGWRLYSGENDLSGKIVMGGSFTTAPAIFEGEDLHIVFEKGGGARFVTDLRRGENGGELMLHTNKAIEGLAYLIEQCEAAVGGKVDKIDGKGLSSNDYTDEEKQKLAGITVSDGGGVSVDLSGYMAKETYDADGDGVVDNAANAAKLGGQLPSYYASKSYADESVNAEQTARETSDTNLANLIQNVVSSLADYVKKADGLPNALTLTINGSTVTYKGTSAASKTWYAPTTAGTRGYILKSNGSGAPTWQQSVPVANGGTGATTAAAARTNLGAAPAYSYGTTDLTAGSSALETGKLYFVYE